MGAPCLRIYSSIFGLPKTWILKRSHIILSFLLAVLLVPFGWAQQTEVWTLKRCLEYARENNITIQQVQLNGLNNKYALTQSRASLFPTVNGSLSHSFSFGLSFDPTSFQQKTQQYQTTSGVLSSRFIIFNGLSNYYDIMANSLLYKASSLDYQQAIDDVSLNIIQLYMQVLFAQERLEIVRQQVDILRQQVERSTILFDAGAITKSTLLGIQSQLATQEVTLVNGENAVAQTTLALAQALNLPNTNIQVEKPDFSSVQVQPVGDGITAEMIYNTAITLRPNVKSSELKFLASKRQLASIRGGYYPTLAFTATISTAFSELRKQNPLDPNSPTIPFFDQLQQNNSQQLSFGMTIPIFNGLTTRMAVQRAKVSVKLAELDWQNQQMRLRNTIQQSYADAKAAYKTYMANLTSLESLREAYDYATERYNAGVINSVDYNDAATRFFNARTELLIAQYDYIFKTKVLDFYRGEPLGF